MPLEDRALEGAIRALHGSRLLYFTNRNEIPKIIAALAEWYLLEDWDGAIKLNRKYLRGELYANLTQFGPLFAESMPLRPALQRLHDFGFLTYSSQRNVFGEPSVDRDGEVWQKWQTAYVSFFVSRWHVSKATLMDFRGRLSLNKDTDLVVVDWLVEPPSYVDFRTRTVSHQVQEGEDP